MIYFLEDDSNIREFVLYALNGQGFEAVGFDRPSLFWDAMNHHVPQLLLLDLMLPEEDGLSILRKIRSSATTKNIPVILLTAKDTEFDKVIGLDSGADDYVPKPFGMMELISRIKALLRRTGGSPSPTEFTADGLYVSPSAHIVRVNDNNINLTFKEYELLLMLLENRGHVLSRNQIQDKIWGYDFDGESRTVDVHIRTLRQKLGPCSDLIETVRGVGYRFKEPRL